MYSAQSKLIRGHNETIQYIFGDLHNNTPRSLVQILRIT